MPANEVRRSDAKVALESSDLVLRLLPRRDSLPMSAFEIVPRLSNLFRRPTAPIEQARMNMGGSGASIRIAQLGPGALAALTITVGASAAKTGECLQYRPERDF